VTHTEITWLSITRYCACEPESPENSQLFGVLAQYELNTGLSDDGAGWADYRCPLDVASRWPNGELPPIHHRSAKNVGSVQAHWNRSIPR